MIGYVNGSPKTGDSNSGLVIGMVQKELDEDHLTVNSAGYQETVWNQLADCQTLILVFPLYVDSLPSHFLQFLMDFERFLAERSHAAIPVYGIAQCGFFDGLQNRHALDILECFCEKSGLTWRGGIGLGGAGAIAGVPEVCRKGIVSRIQEIVSSIKRDVAYSGEPYANIGMPRSLYKIAGNFSWIKEAEKNGLTKTDMYRTEDKK